MLAGRESVARAPPPATAKAQAGRPGGRGNYAVTRKDPAWAGGLSMLGGIPAGFWNIEIQRLPAQLHSTLAATRHDRSTNARAHGQQYNLSGRGFGVCARSRSFTPTRMIPKRSIKASCAPSYDR